MQSILFIKEKYHKVKYLEYAILEKTEIIKKHEILDMDPVHSSAETYRRIAASLMAQVTSARPVSSAHGGRLVGDILEHQRLPVGRSRSNSSGSSLPAVDTNSPGNINLVMSICAVGYITISIAQSLP